MDVLCVGEMLVDIIVRPVGDVVFDGGCSMAEQIVWKTGGDAFNNAVILSKLGNVVGYVGRVGNDYAGQFLLEEGKRQGVMMDFVVPSQSPHTKMNILLNEAGERAFFYYPGTSREFCFEDIDLELLGQSKIVQVGGTFHLPAFDGDGTERLFWEAHKRNVLTSMDVTKDFSGRWNEVICSCYQYLDYFLPSIDQAIAIAKTENVPDIADFFLERGVKNVIIKLGAEGSYFKNQEMSFYCGCYQVPVAETTGAGDAFVAGFLTGLLKGYGPMQCVQTATAVSAFVVQQIGATEGVRPFHEVLAFIKSREPLHFWE